MVITAINLTAIIISSIAIVFSLAALAMIIGMKLSTHKIEFKPLEIKDPFIEDDFKPFTEPSEEIVDEALKLSKEGLERKKKAKDKDPLDEILESNNF
jgi:hypothetical protein